MAAAKKRPTGQTARKIGPRGAGRGSGGAQSAGNGAHASHPVADQQTAAAVRFTRRLLDARPDRLDFRDLPYRPPLRSLEPVWPGDAVIAANLQGYIKAGLVRDQGTEGACTGFGLTCVANYLLWIRHAQSGTEEPFVSVSPRMLYELARRYDEWPGVDYEGSSCRGALKGWNKHGVCAESRWPYALGPDGKPIFVPPKTGWERDAASRPLGVYYRVDKASVVDLQAALNDIGAVYVSANVHDGWDRLLGTTKRPLPKAHASLPVIAPPTDPKSWGGHSFALVGYNAAGFVVQNSWGELWGARGFAVLPYEDWVEHGTDAWVCALGVPVAVSDARLALSRFRVSSGQSLGTQTGTPKNPANPSDDPWPIDHPFDFAAYQPWSTAKAYAHTLVSGNDGALTPSEVSFGVGVDPEPYATKVVRDEPRAWFARQPTGARARVMVYAHGGLNGEDESVRRIRVLGPYAEANGIYPLFMTWKTGPIETLLDIFGDYFKGRPEIGPGPAGGIADELREGADRLIEATSHVMLRGIWTEMRGNAEFSTMNGRALDLLAKKLVALRDALAADNRTLEVHLVGHSAGAILLGWLLDRIARDDLLPRQLGIKTCTLYAPACSVQFALGTYAKVARTPLFKLADLRLHYLSDQNEKADGLPDAQVRLYGKSLLYLVSRALDDARKMPLLGLANAITPEVFDPRQWADDQVASITAWQQAWSPGATGPAQRGFPVTARDVRRTRTGATVQATHGSFDNDIDVLTTTLERIKGGGLVAPMEWLDF
jgi:hypothetical protein